MNESDDQPGVTLSDAVEALRALNSAIWLASPGWAFMSPETFTATGLLGRYDADRR